MDPRTIYETTKALRIYEHSRNYELRFRCFVAKFVDS